MHYNMVLSPYFGGGQYTYPNTIEYPGIALSGYLNPLEYPHLIGGQHMYPFESWVPYTGGSIRTESNEIEYANHDEQDVTIDYTASMLRKGRGHTHAHFGATTCQDGHTHLHPGVTGTPIETNVGHIHKIYGNTTFDDGHIHYYEEYTGPPIPLQDGYHTHYAEMRTTKDDGHVHIIKGFTAPSKS